MKNAPWTIITQAVARIMVCHYRWLKNWVTDLATLAPFFRGTGMKAKSRQIARFWALKNHL